MVDENREYNYRFINYKLGGEIVTSAIFIFTMGYVRSRGTPRSILWSIAKVAAVSNFFGILAAISLLESNKYCDFINEYPTREQLNITLYLTFTTIEGILIQSAIWLLVYKYWEVSWIVPKQLSGE